MEEEPTPFPFGLALSLWCSIVKS